MTEFVDSQRRSKMMVDIYGDDTAPELFVRRIAHRVGFRFRLYRKDLLGYPTRMSATIDRTVVYPHTARTRPFLSSHAMPMMPMGFRWFRWHPSLVGSSCESTCPILMSAG